jgi:predicted transcriptional regulator
MAMTLRLSEDQTRALRDAAAREGTSMHAVALKAIDDYTERRRARRDELLAQIVNEDAAVLARLADT